MNTEPRAVLSGITKSYPSPVGALTVLHDIDLTIAPGSVTVLHGPSGSGKSTLLNLLGMLDRPDAGRVLINGEDVATLDEKSRAALRNRRIGFVFQTADLIPRLSAIDNVALPLEIGGTKRAEAKKAAHALLEAIGLAEGAERASDGLSGGQRQRAAIARALVTEPALLIADEPTSNLDTDNALGVMQLIRDLCHKVGTAAVIATHDGRLLPYADRAVQLVDGRIAGMEGEA